MFNFSKQIDSITEKFKSTIDYDRNESVGVFEQKSEKFNDYETAQIYTIYVKEGEEVNDGSLVLEYTFGGPTIKVFAKKSGVIHFNVEIGDTHQIGDTLFEIFYQKDQTLENIIRRDYKKIVRKILFSPSVIFYAFLFIFIHFILSFLILQIPGAIRDFVSIIYLILTFIVITAPTSAIRYINKPFYVQSYLDLYEDYLSLWSTQLRGAMIFSILFSILYSGIEIKVMEFFNFI